MPVPKLPAAFALAAVLFAGAPAAAQRYPAREVGDWTVAASADGNGCFLSRTYQRPGGTTLLFGIDTDGTNHLTLLNANWSIASRDRLKLDFRLSRGGYAKHFAIGIVSDGKQGFVTNFEAKFPVYFAASTFLRVDRGDIPVERLNLDGSGAAMAELRRCLAMRQPGPTAGKVREEGIPRDPFSPDAKRRSGAR
ncbi:hypothetical protein Q5H94_13505 [Sphingomonas sp. CA1-15]|uniref:Uncharacterized protein n=2 Tax=Sphingomonas immobilis TaxID=3063997 RepID=A0ABT9A1K5_9SPHN|nr:hypothetical protein [Sphingomonas sp. CA1-15]